MPGTVLNTLYVLTHLIVSSGAAFWKGKQTMTSPKGAILAVTSGSVEALSCVTLEHHIAPVGPRFPIEKLELSTPDPPTNL